VRTKVNGDTRERFGQSAKWSTAVRGQAGTERTGCGRSAQRQARRPGAAEPNVGIFCLPGFVADCGPICFSSGSLPRSFPHVRPICQALKPSSVRGLKLKFRFGV
jgi:hypothetical protein